MKITKGKNLFGEGKYIVKVVNQPHTKLGGRFKDKSSKIMYIYNKPLRGNKTNVKYDAKNSNHEGMRVKMQGC